MSNREIDKQIAEIVYGYYLVGDAPVKGDYEYPSWLYVDPTSSRWEPVYVDFKREIACFIDVEFRENETYHDGYPTYLLEPVPFYSSSIHLAMEILGKLDEDKWYYMLTSLSKYTGNCHCDLYSSLTGRRYSGHGKILSIAICKALLEACEDITDRNLIRQQLSKRK